MLINKRIERFKRSIMGERAENKERVSAKGKPGEAGFTLVELLVALTILSIGLLGLAGLATNAMKASNNAMSITQATNIAQDRLELLLSVSIANLNATDLVVTNTDLHRTCTQTDNTLARPIWSCTPSDPVILDNKTYTWDYTITHIDLDGDGTAILSHDALLRLDLNVYWNDILWGGQKTLSMTTLRALD